MNDTPESIKREHNAAADAFTRISRLAERRLRPHQSDIDSVRLFMEDVIRCDDAKRKEIARLRKEVGRADTERADANSKLKTTRSKLNQFRHALRHADDEAMIPETRELLLGLVDNLLDGV